MNWRIVGVIFRNEIRMLLRDRRTIAVGVLLPLLIYPLMIYANRVTTRQREKNLTETVYKYAVSGSQAAQARALIARGQAASPGKSAPQREEAELPGIQD